MIQEASIIETDCQSTWTSMNDDYENLAENKPSNLAELPHPIYEGFSKLDMKFEPSRFNQFVRK